MGKDLLIWSVFLLSAAVVSYLLRLFVLKNTLLIKLMTDQTQWFHKQVSNVVGDKSNWNLKCLKQKASVSYICSFSPLHLVKSVLEELFLSNPGV